MNCENLLATIKCENEGIFHAKEQCTAKENDIGMVDDANDKQCCYLMLIVLQERR